MSTTTDPSVFEPTDRREITLTEADLLGTHVFNDVLYTGSTAVVNALSGETPATLDRDIEEAKAFAERVSRDGDAPRVAKAQHPEAAVESRSPYVASPFFHRDITGSMEWHTVFRRAYDSDAYDVEYDADYQTGTLTITVERATSST